MTSRTDFAWMYFAMHLVWLHLRDGQSVSALYSVTAQRAWMLREHVPFSGLDLFSYPPQFALAFAPLAAAGYRLARTLWTVLSLAWFLGGLAFACALAVPRRAWWVWAVVGGAGLACFPALTTFYWGQTDTLILFLTAAGLWLIYRGRRPALGGAALALGAVFKITPAIVLAYYGARWALSRYGLRKGAPHPPGAEARRARMARDRAVLVGGLAAAAVCLAVTAATLGAAPIVAYVTQALPQVQQVALAVGPAPMEQSLRGVLLLLVRDGPLTRAAVDGLSVAAAAALLAVDLRRPGGDIRPEAAGVATLCLVCAPSLEGHHFVVAALPEVVLGGWLLAARAPVRWVALAAYGAAVLLLAVPGYPFLPAVGRPLCSLGGHSAWIGGGNGALALACDGQHLWSVLLLYGLALYGLTVRQGARRRQGPPRPPPARARRLRPASTRFRPLVLRNPLVLDQRLAR